MALSVAAFSCWLFVGFSVFSLVWGDITWQLRNILLRRFQEVFTSLSQYCVLLWEALTYRFVASG